jgi:hypothetical protein
MILSLHARVSFIDKYGKLWIIPDADSFSKLSTHWPDHQKYDNCYPITVSSVPIPTEYVGLDCKITVKLRRYKFTSHARHNAGNIVQGINLILVDITRSQISLEL